MLSSLFISNYALIDNLEIDFDSGLNIITGETGSGKSIVLGALSLLMGERADLKAIRSLEKKTVVEAKFKIGSYPGFNNLLTEFDVDTDDESCVLRREITAKGTSRSFINDTPVNLNSLREVAQNLIDIHSQHQNQQLTTPSYQFQILDVLAGNGTLLDEYRLAYTEYRKALKEYNEFREELKRNKSQAEFNIYLLQQFENLNIQEGEQERLESERDNIANETRINQHLKNTLDPLTDAEQNVLGLISDACFELDNLKEYIESSETLLERLCKAKVEIEDIVGSIQEYAGSLKSSEADLDAIERRLSDLYSLQSRHNVKTDVELIAIRNKLRAAVENAENGDEILKQKEISAKAAKKNSVLIARRISEGRLLAAQKLAEELKTRAIPLGMNNLRCEIRVTADKLKENGIDDVEFLFAFNKNQPMMPVGKTASGGEISRLILALKSVLVEKMKLPTIIFDEVDTGVSGDVANRMAQLMIELSKATQVITITHIATVAAHGKRHFKVYKQDGTDYTHTHIKLLDTEERLHEIALMISGDGKDKLALETAKALLDKE